MNRSVIVVFPYNYNAYVVLSGHGSPITRINHTSLEDFVTFIIEVLEKNYLAILNEAVTCDVTLLC